jgi:hypothetical protein
MKVRYLAAAAGVVMLGGLATGMWSRSDHVPMVVITPPMRTTWNGIEAPRDHTAMVRVNGAWTALGDTANLDGAALEDSVRYHFPQLHTNRIRRECTIDSVRVFTGSTTATGYTGVWIQIVRRHAGQRFSFVGQTPNLVTGTRAGIQAVRLARPIRAKSGDQYVLVVRKIAGLPGGPLFHAVASKNAVIRQAANVDAPAYPPGVAGYRWYDTAIAHRGANIEVELLTVTPPQVVVIGYSHLEGRNLQYGYAHDVTMECDTTSATDPSLVVDSWDRFLFGMPGSAISWENASVGGESSTQIRTRAPRDCYALKPRLAVIQLFGNDHRHGVSVATGLSNLRAMIDSLKTRAINAAFILPVQQSGMDDAWAASIDSLISPMLNVIHDRMPAAIIVDPRHVMAACRAGAVCGNRWGSVVEYSTGDSLHWNEAGQRAFAFEIGKSLGIEWQADP